MQNTIKIDSGIKRIAIEDENGNIKGEITFNPADTGFMERFYRLYPDLTKKLEEFKQRAEVEESDSEVINDEIVQKRFDLIRDMNDAVKERIDYAFGEGTSKIVFGDVISYDFNMYFQFLDGIKPFIEPVRVQKTNKYIPSVKKPSMGTGRKRK